MTFAWPHLLWLLALPLSLLVWEIALARRSGQTASGDKILRGEAGARQLTLEAGSTGSPRSRLRRVWLALGVALCIVALARPQWGKVDEQVFEQSREILVALDLSRSMLSQDVQPSRLQRAKLLVQVLLDRLKGERIGLVVFSGTSFLQCPLSTDYEILREFLPSLGPGALPVGGTNYRAMLQTALDAFGKSTNADRFLIVLSDGEATDNDWKPLVPELHKRGIRVIGLGIGTKAGSFIPDGSGGFVKDERGAVVLSKLEPATLQDLASETDGTYRDASTWVDLASVLKQTVEAGRAGTFAEKREQRAIERFQWVLAPGVILLFLSLAFEFPVQVRPRPIGLGKPGTPTPPSSGGKPPPPAALLLLLFGLAAAPHLLAEAAPAPKGPETPLGIAVERLATKPSLNAADCADLTRKTIAWGQGLRSSGQPIPDGPLRDALDAITLGDHLDSKAADWDTLRHQINTLREPPPKPKKQDQKKQDQKDQEKHDQDKKNQGKSGQNPSHKQSPQDKSKSQQSQSHSPQQQGQSSQKQDQTQPQQPSQSDSKNGAEGQRKPPPPSPNSGFGDMKKPAHPPQPQPARSESQPMQTVGGADRQPRGLRDDPALLVPLEKLDKVKSMDSPGKLFEMIQSERKPPPPAANQKDW